MEHTFHVYMMASKSGVLYLGVTGHLAKRVSEHKLKLRSGFTQKYNVTKLCLVRAARHGSRGDLSREGNQGLVAGEEGGTT
jgi:predicted GIY-YIG superfamily endonuclease